MTDQAGAAGADAGKDISGCDPCAGQRDFDRARCAVRDGRTQHSRRAMRTWKNAPPTLRDLFLLSRKFGERTFVVYGDERVSYEEFARAAHAVAEALRAAGLQKGDRVAIAMRNLPEWPVAFFGCLLAGGVATLLNAWWTGPELEYGLNDSGAKVRLRRSRAARAHVRASAQLPGARAGLCQPRERAMWRIRKSSSSKTSSAT